MRLPYTRARTPAFLVICTLLLALAVGAAALGVGGCGGDDRSSFEQYLDDLRPALDDGLVAMTTLAEAFETAGQTDPADLAVAAEGCSEAAVTWAAARDAVEAVDAPPELQQATASLVESFSLEADLYGKMGTVLSEMADSMNDPARLNELMTRLEALDPSGVGETVKAQTKAWTEAVKETTDELGLEPPQWLQQWVEDLEAAGQRLEDL